MNEFTVIRGAERLKKPQIAGLFLLVSVFIAFVISRFGVMAGLGVAFVPVALLFLTMVFINPRVGLFTLLALNFFALGIYRYIPQIPWGLAVDGMLALTYVSLFFRSFHHKPEWKNAYSELTLLALIWFGYAVFELLNPEAGSRVAWFYAVRGIALHMILTIPLIFVIFNKESDLRLFLMIWGVFSILGTLKGLMQKYVGVDPFEQRWLDSGGAAQHLLFGELRIFSFYADAGTFGASQGQAGVVFSILALGKEKIPKRIFYALVGLLGFFGMMISGTRGAMSVPFAGILLFIILRKNMKFIIMGTFALVAIFIFFKYTHIGESNGTIRRMRTAFNPKDASLQTRLTNQNRIKEYLATRPLGGGIGSTGGIGQKYNPGTFLSKVPSDSWYVQIWMEGGIIGLVLHLCILFYILVKISYFVMFKLKSERVKIPVMAMASGMFGIMVASYGNPVLGQMPVGIMLYTCMAFMYLSPRFDREESTNDGTKPQENNRTILTNQLTPFPSLREERGVARRVTG